MTGWKTAALGDVCSLIARGVAPKYVEQGGVLVLNQKCVRDHDINYDLARRHDASEKRVAADRFVQSGDVLINSTGTGTLGRVAQLRSDPLQPTTVDTHVTIVRPSPGEFYPDFFGYALVVLEEQLAASGEGASGQTELARTTVTKIEISYPTDLDEQRRIVAVLDEAFTAIATAIVNAEKNLANARELFEAELANVFGSDRLGWEGLKLGTQLSVQSGFAFRSSDYVDAGHFLVRIGNVQSGHLALKNPKYVHLDSKTAKFALQEGDILTSLTGDIGRVATVHESHLPAALNQRVARLIPSPKSNVSREYLLLFLRSDFFRLQLESKGHGAAQLNVSPKEIAEVEFHAPDEATQKVILSRLTIIEDAVTALAAIYEEKQSKLLELKQALLHRAFTSKITAAKPETLVA